MSVKLRILFAAAVVLSLGITVQAVGPDRNPVTSDDSLIGAWIAMMILSAIGIVITVILLFKTPKE